MIEYTYFPPDPTLDERRSVLMDEAEAHRMIGDRALMGFDLVQRFFRDPDDRWTHLVYFQSEVTGHVWALYCAA